MSGYRWKKFTKKDIERFKKAIKNGTDWKTIGRIYGVSPATVSSWAKKFGIEKPN